MTSLPLVSVVMSTYNREELMPRAIDSILAQTYKDFEFIIIDDGSTDGTPEILARYARQDERISLLWQENSGGEGMGRNYGSRVARGKYLMFMDDDDSCSPQRLVKQLDFLRRNPDLAACICMSHWVDEHSRFIRPFGLPGYELQSGAAVLKKSSLLPFTLGSYTLIERAAYHASGGYRPFYITCGDYELALRFQEKFRGRVLQEYLYYHRAHEAKRGSSISTRDGLKNTFRYVVAHISAYCRRNGTRDPITQENPYSLTMLDSLPPVPRQVQFLIAENYLNLRSVKSELEHGALVHSAEALMLLKLVLSFWHPIRGSKFFMMKGFFIVYFLRRAKWMNSLAVLGYGNLHGGGIFMMDLPRLTSKILSRLVRWWRSLIKSVQRAAP